MVYLYNISYINEHFGQRVAETFVRWIKLNYKSIKILCKIAFLKNCKSNFVYPQHISTLSNLEINLFHYKSVSRLNRCLNAFKSKILKLEIFDSYRQFYNIQSELRTITHILYSNLPFRVWKEITESHFTTFNNCEISTSKKYNNKLKWLMIKNQRKIVKEIIPISYTVNNNNLPTLRKYSQNKPRSSDSLLNVDITPDSFNGNIMNSLTAINNKWFLNLSEEQIPTEVCCLLQHGDRFSVPLVGDKKLMVYEFIKELECCVSRLNIHERSRIRNIVVPELVKFMKFKLGHTDIESKIFKMYKSTVTFLRTNKNVMFTRADKGNSTVAMSIENYNTKMKLMLDDKETYSTIDKNPTKSIENNLNDILKRWVTKEFIDFKMSYKLKSSDLSLPKAYGVPKTHKKDYPLRIIVSCINTPLYSFACFLHKIIKNSVPKARSYINNSFDLYKKLSGSELDEQYKLVSLDVVSLFTNVPLELVMESLDNRWSYLEKNTNISKREFLLAVRFVYSSTYFTFNNTIYKQIFGTPMGSPLSPILADLVLQDIENKAFYRIGPVLPFFYRYVDDIIMAAPAQSIERVVEVFNSYHDRLQFTVEFERQNTISFLDLKIIKTKNENKNNSSNFSVLAVDWFQKPTFSGRYLSYFSQHPECHKIGTIYGLVDRALLLSDPTYHQKNLEFVINILLNNGYPLAFVFEHIRNRIRWLLRTKLNCNAGRVVDGDNEVAKRYVAFPYIRSITEFVNRSLKNTDFSAGYKCLNKLNTIIKAHKDKTQQQESNNVVYKISCADCEASYVGQTKRMLKTRVREHRMISRPSVVKDHMYNENHTIDWNNVKILDHERNYTKRLISEMLYIQEQTEGMNLKTDTQFLDDIYIHLLSSLR